VQVVFILHQIHAQTLGSHFGLKATGSHFVNLTKCEVQLRMKTNRDVFRIPSRPQQNYYIYIYV